MLVQPSLSYEDLAAEYPDVKFSEIVRRAKNIWI